MLLNPHADHMYIDFEKKENTSEASRYQLHQQLLPREGRAGLSHTVPIHDFILRFHIICIHRKYIVQNSNNTVCYMPAMLTRQPLF